VKIKVHTNLWAGILSVAFALVIWIAMPYQIAAGGDSVATNPRLFPQIFCVLIGILGVILIVSSLAMHREDVKEYDLKIEGKQLLYYGMIVAYVLCISRFGFLIPSVAFALLTLVYYRCRKPLYYIITISFAVALYLIFTYVLGVRFP